MDARTELAAAQQRLVAALVAGAPLPPGFDAERVAVAGQALLRKRAGEVARAWPGLADAWGADWSAVFIRWADGRAPRGGWQDGFDFARTHRDGLPDSARVELAVREALWVYAGTRPPRPRRLPAVRRFPGGVAVGILGHVAIWHR